MRFGTLLLSAAAITLGLAAPAAADYVRLGSVDVGFHTDLDRAFTRFGGGLVGLRFVAGGSDIHCNDITVHYANGDRQTVFSGHLDEHQPVYADLRGGVRRVDHINFHCRSEQYSGGRIYIEGDPGRFLDEWRHDRDWDRTWAGIFGGGGHAGPGAPGGDWILLGREVFVGSNDRDETFAGWAGRRIDHIALRPVEGDARCNRVDARFEDGYNAKLDQDRYLHAGQMSVYDLPGYKHNVVSFYFRCHAIGDGQVTIEVYTHR